MMYKAFCYRIILSNKRMKKRQMFIHKDRLNSWAHSGVPSPPREWQELQDPLL